MAETRRKTVYLIVHMLGRGGTDRVCAHLAGGYVAAGYNTEIVALCAGGRAEALLRELAGSGVGIHHLQRRSTGSRQLDLVRGRHALVRHLRRGQPDCVVSTGNSVNRITALAFIAAHLKSARLC